MVWFEEGSTTVPPDFHQNSARVPPISSRVRRGLGKVPQGFHQGFTRVRGPGWFGVMFHENSTRFCKVRFHSSTVLAGSHKVLRELRGGPGWFEVSCMRVSGFHKILRWLWALRFHRVPQSSARIPHGFHKAPQCSTKGVSCARRRMKIALLMGGTLSKTEINGF